MAQSRPITTTAVTITQPGKAPIPGYLAQPAGMERAPGVLVIHEAGGLNGQIRDVANRFAGAGYAALAVDLFADGNRTLCMLRVMAEPFLRPRNNWGLRTLRASLDWLQTQPHVDADRIGVIGFCLGGGYALMLACLDDDLQAASIFYGNNPRPLSAVAKACPIVGSYGLNDPVTRRGAVKLEAALSSYGIPHDIKLYPGARHAFFNDRLPTYNAEAAQDAWARTLAFFQTHLNAATSTRHAEGRAGTPTLPD